MVGRNVKDLCMHVLELVTIFAIRYRQVAIEGYTKDITRANKLVFDSE